MRKVIALDLDGVLADFKQGWQGVDIIGDPIPGARKFAEILAKHADILIYTARLGEDLNKGSIHLREKAIREWLEKHQIPFHGIWTGRGKPTASAYIDDHAVDCRPQATNATLEYVRAACQALTLCGLDGEVVEPAGE